MLNLDECIKETYRGYHPLARKLHKKRLTNVIQAIASEKASSILDVGCRNGIILANVNLKTKFGLDVTYYGPLNNFIFIKADAEHLPFKPEAFDIVTACEVLEHLYDMDTAINEIKRVTKKDGYIIITIPNDVLNSLGRAFLLRFLSSSKKLSAPEIHRQKGNLPKGIQQKLGKPVYKWGILLLPFSLPYFLPFYYLSVFKRS